MNRDILLNADNTVPMANGDLKLAADLDAIAQDVRTALRLFQGDWFLSSEGLDFDRVMGRTRIDDAKSEIRRLIESRQGVVGVVSLSLTVNYSTRVALVRFSAMTDLGLLGPTEVEV
jgi:hypothetical protein